MTEATPLDYSSKPTRRSGRRWVWVAASVGLLLLLGMASLVVSVHEIESRMDAVTGTMTRDRRSFFGLSRGFRRDVSPLEMELTRRGIAWTPDWWTLHVTDRNLFGGAMQYACGSAPEIYSVQRFLGPYAAAATDDELREFVRVMQSGTEAERQSAASAAENKAMTQSIAGGPGGTPTP